MSEISNQLDNKELMVDASKSMPPSYPTPSNETARLAALDRLNILDTPRAPDFDAVVAVATEVLGCPIGLISLVASDRQWFKAETGLGISETSRDVAFCNQAILGPEPLLIEDATIDDRFKDNPLVTSGPRIRFYAGVPLDIDEGKKVGTLCVKDTVPRRLTEQHVSILKNLGRIVEGLIASHTQTACAAEQAARARSLAQTAEERLRNLTHKTKLLSQSERLAKIGSWEVDPASGKVHLSDEVYRIHELEIGVPVNLERMLAFFSPDSRTEVAHFYQTLVETGSSCEFEHEIETAKGHRRWVRAMGDREMLDGKVVNIFGIIQDVTEKRENERRLWEAANYDVLTAIPNRFNWNLKLSKALDTAKTAAKKLAILILDLDGFKEINDTRGHADGDAVLREVARRLGASLPAHAFYARLGGDEFAVLLENDSTKTSVETLATLVLADIRRPIVLDDHNVQVSGTFGCASFPKDASTASGLMKSADIALYQAKRSRRSSILMYHKGIAGLFDEKRQAIDLIHSALTENRLEPFYQPKIDLKNGRIVGFEALARVRLADGTVVGPAHFAPALQDPGAASLIGSRMLDMVTADMAAWGARGFAYGSVAINLAESDFASGDLPARIASRLDMLGLPVTSLQIEVTENVVLGKGADSIAKALRALHALGIIIALDDFGTGFASLKHLRDLQVDIIKIDRSFVAGLGDADDCGIIVRSVIELGHALGKLIVAEGVETQAQIDFLRSNGCDTGQGFLFGPPVAKSTLKPNFFLGERHRPVADQTLKANISTYSALT